MKFLTEADLRDRYNKEPFDPYIPEPGTKLTPGGRQFLLDRGIRLTEETRKGAGKHCFGRDDQNTDGENARTCGQTADWHRKLCTVQADFLDAGLRLMERDTLTAKELFDLERALSEAEKGNEAAFPFTGCTGIPELQCRDEQEDCFEITGFHAQSPNGITIITLHGLRCRLRELIPEIPEKERREICKIINRLSQMICMALGGKLCQKQ